MTRNNQRIDLQAAAWAVRMHDRAMTAEEQSELDRWLAADSRHRGALLRACAAWLDLDRLAALTGRYSTGERVENRNSPAEDSGELDDSKDGSRERAIGHSFRLFTSRRRFMAASITTLLFGGAATWWMERRSNVYLSDVGEIRRFTLSDGSHMILNTATQATVHYDQTRREIELAVGEGLFQVAKDPARPFIVRAGSISVRAVGTVFAVRTIDQRVDVTVTEGVVELADNSGLGDAVVRRVAANEHATVMDTREVAVHDIPQAEAERRLAWRDGMVDFAGEPLSTAVSEINRHNRRHIIVDDPFLASRPVVGLFRANNPEDFAATVAAALGAQSVDQIDAIHLRSLSGDP